MLTVKKYEEVTKGGERKDDVIRERDSIHGGLQLYPKLEFCTAVRPIRFHFPSTETPNPTFAMDQLKAAFRLFLTNQVQKMPRNVAQLLEHGKTGFQ